MTARRDTLEALRDVATGIFALREKEAAAITGHTTLDSLGADSLDALEFVQAVEDELAVDLPMDIEDKLLDRPFSSLVEQIDKLREP